MKIFYTLEEAADKPIESLGGKGFNLVRMQKLGLKVPPFIIIPTEMCLSYQTSPQTTMSSIKAHLPMMTDSIKETAGFGYMPLVSVRSGAKVSMPGMMDTILNVGLDMSNIYDWQKRLSRECADDSFTRLIEMYGNVVKGLDRKIFHGKKWVARRTMYSKRTEEEFPNSDDQLLGAIEAVFKSWNNPRAISYRDLNKIPHDLGTAVVIQAMVFGNLNEQSCTGVLFTLDPSTGENEVTGEFLVTAQGEDVVAGLRTPLPLSKMHEWSEKAADELLSTVESLEQKLGDMQDVEFTIQDGILFFLQTRDGKRTAQAALRIAIDMYDAELIDADTVLKRVSYKQFLGNTRPSIPEKASIEPTVVGLAASTGVASGIAVTSSKAAVACKEACILITDETNPDDIDGMIASVGILTRRGGRTSHAAVVARGMDKVAVVGCGDLPKVLPGTRITICGGTGRVWLGEAPAIEGGSESTYIKRLLEIVAEKHKYIRVVHRAKDMSPKGCLLAVYATPKNEVVEALKIMEDGFIDLTTANELAYESEKVMLNLFGETVDCVEMQLIVKELLMFPALAIDLEKNITLILGKCVSPVMIELLKKRGFKIMERVKDLASLILANGFVLFDVTALDITNDVLEKTLSLKHIAGDKLHHFRILDCPGNVSDLDTVAMADSIALQTYLAA